MISSFFMGRVGRLLPCPPPYAVADSDCHLSSAAAVYTTPAVREKQWRLVLGVEAMIFDFGNVLIGWDPENLYRKLIPDAAERKHFLTEICNGPWNALQDAGRSWDEAIAEQIALHPDRADHIRAYRNRFAEMLTGPVAEGT